MGENSIKEFVIPENRTGLLKKNVKRIGVVFSVEVSLTSKDRTSDQQWVQLRGNDENTIKAKDYIKSLCTPERVQAKTIPAALFQSLRTGEKTMELEFRSCAVLSFSDIKTSQVSVHGTEIAVAMAVSDIEEQLRCFTEQRNVDDFTSDSSFVDSKTKTASKTTETFSNTTERKHDAIGSVVDIPPSMRDFARKLNYSDHDIDAVVKRFGPEITINELLQELVKNSASSRQNGISSDDAIQLPVYRENCASPQLPPNGADAWLVARGPPAPMRSWKPETVVEPLTDVYRPIVIDGSNVAMNHGNQEVFSCRGIQLCVEYFERRGHHDITVFVPMWRKEEPGPGNQIIDQDVLHELSRRNILKYTPSRSNGNRRFVCYDDKFIVDLAHQNGGIIVSNDNFRDLLKENPRWKEAIEERTLMYTFAGDLFMPPDDPLGRRGPSLNDFLRRGTSTHPRVCPYLKNCTFGHRCKFYHPERDSRRQQNSNLSSAVNASSHSTTATESSPSTVSHTARQSPVISTSSNHSTVSYADAINKDRGRRPDNIAVRGSPRDSQPREPRCVPYEPSAANGPHYQQYHTTCVYPEYRHPILRDRQRYQNSVPRAVYHPDMNHYQQFHPQCPPQVPPVSFAPNPNAHGLRPSVMGHPAGQAHYVDSFAYYEPAAVPYRNWRGRSASRDHVDGAKDNEEENNQVGQELFESLADELKDIAPREDIIRVLRNHQKECGERDLNALAIFVLDATM